MDLQFNESCIQHKLLPVYTNVKVHDTTARDQKIVLDFRRRLLLRQINLHAEGIKDLQK